MAIVAANWLSISTVDMAFNAVVDPEFVKRAHAWHIVPTDPAPPVSVYAASVKTGNLTVTIRIGPNAVPGAEYTISASPSEGAALASIVTTAPANLTVPPSPEWSHGLIRSLTSTFGEAIQRFNGRPHTLTVQPFWSGDSRLFVESTLGWPSAGYALIAGKRYSYSGLEPMAFTGLADVDHYGAFPRQSLVSFDVRSHLPD